MNKIYFYFKGKGESDYRIKPCYISKSKMKQMHFAKTGEYKTFSEIIEDKGLVIADGRKRVKA